MNQTTFDFASMTTEQLVQFAKDFLLEIWQRSQPIKTVVIRVIKTVKSWLF